MVAWDRWRAKRSAIHPSLSRPLGTALPITNTEREVLHCVAQWALLSIEESLRRIAWEQRKNDLPLPRREFLAGQREQIAELKGQLEDWLSKIRQ